MATDDIVKYMRLSQTRFNRHAEAADEIERINESLRVELSALRQQEAEIHEFREERDTIRKQLDEARELLIAAQELLCLVWEYDGDVFSREHNIATDVNIGITAWLERNKG